MKSEVYFYKAPYDAGYVVEAFANGKAYQMLRGTKADARRRVSMCRQALRLLEPPSRSLRQIAHMSRATGADKRGPMPVNKRAA